MLGSGRLAQAGGPDPGPASCTTEEERKTHMPDSTTPENDGLLLAVETLSAAHDRHEAERSDPTSTSAGDDGENRDSSV
jgi:hypothetical protein